MILTKTCLERVSNVSIGSSSFGGLALGLGGLDVLPDLFQVSFFSVHGRR